jgi:type I restriction enzyme, S subunit
MNNKRENSLVPELRFPEFNDEKKWEIKQLVNLGDTISGLSGKSGDDFGTGKPFVTYKQVFDNAYINLSKCAKVNISENENQNKLQKGDVLFTTSSEIPNEVGFASVLIDLPTEPTYLNSFCFSFRPKNLENLIPEFSRYLFHSSIYRKSISVLAQGSTRYNISKGAFLNLKLPIPKSKEQKKIADCLSSLDDVISAQSQKIDGLKDHKKGLMQIFFPAKGELKPKLRFTEFKNNDEWIEEDLKSICTMQAGKFVNASEITQNMNNDLFPCYGGNGLRGYTKSFTHSGTYSLIGRQGALCGNVTLAHKKFHATEHAIVVKPEMGINTVWLFYMLIHLNLNQYATGQAQPGLSVENLKRIIIKRPISEKEQQKIANCLSSVDNQIEVEVKYLNILKDHKKGLMQQLFPEINE